jgi:hypothetical protein
VRSSFFLFLGLSLPVVIAVAGDVPPVTVMGEKLLPRTHLVVQGSVTGVTRLGTGASLARFSVAEVLRGSHEGSTLMVLSTDPAYFPERDIPCVLFLKRLGGARYEPVARVDVTGDEGRLRFETLRRFLRIEAVEDHEEKVRKLHDLLLLNLLAEEPFLVWNAARELAHFTREHVGAFDAEDLEKIELRAAGAANPVLKELLQEAAANLAAIRPAPSRPADGEEPRPARPRRPVVPPPPEFRDLLAAWERGGLDASERWAVVQAACARHLKYAAPILLAAIRDEDAQIRTLAARNLGEGLVAEGEGPLLALLATEKHPAVLEAAIQSLGILRSEKALEAILPHARLAALLRAVAFAAARIGTPEALGWLRDLKAERAGSGEEDRAVRDLVDFLSSTSFREQEKAMDEVRRRRLR